MRPKHLGFSLIQIAITILVLGGLVALLVPQLTTMSDESSQAEVRTLAAMIETASARNHNVDIAIEEGLTTTVTDPFTNIDNCQDAAQLLDGKNLPKGYSIPGKEIIDKDSVTCSLLSERGKQATFVLTGALGGY